jgi:hypothetical protein
MSLDYSFVRGCMVDLIGIEPMTSSMPWKRAPSCATGPLSRKDFSILAEYFPPVNRPRNISARIGVYIATSERALGPPAAHFFTPLEGCCTWVLWTDSSPEA